MPKYGILDLGLQKSPWEFPGNATNVGKNPLVWWTAFAAVVETNSNFIKTQYMAIVDFKDDKNCWKSYGPVVSGAKKKSHYYGIFTNIKDRCKVGGLQQKLHPRYIGCTMSTNFQNEQFFANWCQEQIGYGFEKYHIDKDILTLGNKEYHEDKCVFVPQELNLFLTASNASRGACPQGVWLHKPSGKFLTSISIDGVRKRLGGYQTCEQASVVYAAAKNAEGQRWHKRLLNKEFIVDPRVTERMRVWTFTEEI